MTQINRKLVDDCYWSTTPQINYKRSDVARGETRTSKVGDLDNDNKLENTLVSEEERGRHRVSRCVHLTSFREIRGEKREREKRKRGRERAELKRGREALGSIARVCVRICVRAI